MAYLIEDLVYIIQFNNFIINKLNIIITRNVILENSIRFSMILLEVVIYKYLKISILLNYFKGFYIILSISMVYKSTIRCVIFVNFYIFT